MRVDPEPTLKQALATLNALGFLLRVRQDEVMPTPYERPAGPVAASTVDRRAARRTFARPVEGKVIAGVADRTANKPVAQQERAVSGLMAVYQRGVIPAQFRLLVSPLVAWIWIGGLIVCAGGLSAPWPARSPPTARWACG